MPSTRLSIKVKTLEKVLVGKKRYDFIEASNFRVELEMFEELPENIEEFRDGITKVIIALRTKGRLLVETTLADEFLIEKTGWTYTKSSPKPPTS